MYSPAALAIDIATFLFLIAELKQVHTVIKHRHDLRDLGLINCLLYIVGNFLVMYASFQIGAIVAIFITIIVSVCYVDTLYWILWCWRHKKRTLKELWSHW